MIQKRILFIALAALLTLSCENDPLDVDASKVKLDISFVNLDSVIFLADSVTLQQSHAEFKRDLGELYDYYQGYVMGIGNVEDTAFYNSIRIFRGDTGIIRLEKEIRSEFNDLSVVSDNLREGFRHLKYHLKKYPTPENIVYMNSLFRSGVWCSEDAIGIGLDYYLGPESKSVKLLPPGYYDWIRKAMDRKFLETDVLTGWIETNIVDEATGTLAEQMVRWGKILYLAEAAFPDKEEYLILRYNAEQYQWAEENEFAFWDYLVKEKMLFEENERNAMNFLNPGPTTSGLPMEGSPDRLGRYLGWRMVHSYMKKNETSPDELLKVDYNTILQDYEIE